MVSNGFKPQYSNTRFYPRASPMRSFGAACSQNFFGNLLEEEACL